MGGVSHVATVVSTLGLSGGSFTYQLVIEQVCAMVSTQTLHFGQVSEPPCASVCSSVKIGANKNLPLKNVG